MRERLLKRIADIIYLHHHLILVLAVLVTVGAGYLYSRLELHLTFLDMLSEEEPAVKQYRYASRNFGSLSFLFVVLEADQVEQAKAYADALAPRLAKNPEFVKRVYYKWDTELFSDHGLLFLPPEALSELARLAEENRPALAELHDRPGLVSLAQGVDALLGGVLARGQLPESSGAFKPESLFVPLDNLVGALRQAGLEGKAESQSLRASLVQNLLGEGQKLPFDLSDPYMLSGDKRHLLFLVEPAQPAENFEWCTKFMEYVEAETAALDRELPGVKHGATGNAAVMRDDNRVIRADMVRTTTVAFLLIMALFAFSFRNLSSILIVGLSLALGIIWSMGTAYLTIGYLTPITSIFGAILLGLGVDYAILILSRYTEERHRGHTIKQALDLTLTQTGKGILTGAVATSLAFFTITAGSFRGAQEMGMVAGCGILVFVVLMIFVQTSMIITWDSRRTLRGPTQKRLDPKVMRLIARLVSRGAPVVFGLLAAAVGYFAYLSPRYSLEYNYLNLEPLGVESIQLINKIPEWFNMDTNYGMVIADSVEQDREFTRRLKEKSTVSLVDSISTYLPENQADKLPSLRRLETVFDEFAGNPPIYDPQARLSAEDYADLRDALAGIREKSAGLEGLAYLADLEEVEKAAQRLGQNLDRLLADWDAAGADRVRANLAGLEQKTARGTANAFRSLARMSRSRGLTLAQIQTEYPELAGRFQGKDGRFLLYVYPSLVIWNENNLKAVVADLKAVSPEAMGVGVLFERILDQVKHDLFRIAIYALLGVMVVITLDYRRPLYILLTMVPLVAGALSMVGVMNYFDIKFNIINIAMLPLIVGVGIDYGVYVVHRWIAEGRDAKSIRPVVESTGRAVVLAALTTMIGFGSLALAQWRGLANMGRVMSMGVGFCLIGAIFLLPALLALISKK